MFSAFWQSRIHDLKAPIDNILCLLYKESRKFGTRSILIISSALVPTGATLRFRRESGVLCNVHDGYLCSRKPRDQAQ
jgi:hypothetical protein